MRLCFRYLHHNCNKIFRSILGKSGSNIFSWRATAFNTARSHTSHTRTSIIRNHLQLSTLLISAVINVNSLYTYDGHLEDDMESISSNAKIICEFINQESEGKVTINDTPINDSNACSSGISTLCDAKTINSESKKLGLLAADSCTDYHSSQSDSDCLGLDLLFDMTKVVDNVKIKVKEKRQKREMLEKVSSPIKSHRKTPCDFQSSKMKDKRKEKKMRQRNKYSEKYSSTDQSESDGLGLESLFEETKSVHTEKKKTEKARKNAKRLADKESTANESLGLELMFSDHNPVLRKRVKVKRKKRNVSEKLYGSKEDDDLATEHDEEEIVTVKKKKPNYFVAIRVSNPKIHLAVTDFQASVLKENAKLKPALIPLPSLHLTMAVMHLDESLIELAKGALQKCKIEITQVLKCVDFKLRFVGVGNFNHEVVFAKVEEEKYCSCLKAINEVITAAFEEEGICVREGKEWKPHLTLLKLSRKPALRKKGIRKVKEDMYISWCDYNFGEELVNNVYLCSMFEPKEQDGFYKCVATVSMNDDMDEFNQHLEPKD